MPKVTMIPPTKQDISGKIRVAAYCRVSTSSAEQHNSFVVQTEYYQNKFQNSDTKILVKIYADEGESGVNSSRENFQKMIKDCHKGKIDRIYTKSISRFARNTKDCLQYVRELKSIGVSIVFEKEHIDTALLSNEMMLTIMSQMAQEESVSMSRNIRWSIRKKMKNGTFKIPRVPIGYERVDGKIVIQPKQAEIVRKIFEMAYSGYGSRTISDYLTHQKIPSPFGKERWEATSVINILKNEWYIGDTLYQKTFATDTIPFRQMLNRGEYEQYYAENTHEAIIDKEVFEKVQELISQRISKHKPNSTYLFTGKIQCGKCGFSYIKDSHRIEPSWVCRKHRRTASDCQNGTIKEEFFQSAFIAMYNKLAVHYTEILLPVYQSLYDLKIKKFSGRNQVTNIQKEMAQLREQIHVLASLVTKGFLSNQKYQEQSAGLQTRIAKLQKELSRLTHADDEDDVLEQISELINYFENHPDKMTEFDENAFNCIVEKIIVHTENELEFHLIGDFHFKEFI
ncbi:MAG: recombinase family protein [Oscillospiraceae bacterium]